MSLCSTTASRLLSRSFLERTLFCLALLFDWPHFVFTCPLFHAARLCNIGSRFMEADRTCPSLPAHFIHGQPRDPRKSLGYDCVQSLPARFSCGGIYIALAVLSRVVIETTTLTHSLNNPKQRHQQPLSSSPCTSELHGFSNPIRLWYSTCSPGPRISASRERAHR